jgi:hypothetical protein
MARDLKNRSFWYSLVAASPNPETEEAANVAVVVGNGKVVRLEFLERLPRLCGLANPEDIAVYEAVLRGVAERANRGIDPAELQDLMGAQLRIMRKRELYKQISDDLIARLKKQYLERPSGQAVDDATRALVRRSTARLDEALAGVVSTGTEIARRVTPRKLYGHKLDRYVRYRVAPIERAIRLPNVDVLVDSIVVEPETRGRPLSQATVRVSQAFYAYKKLRPEIQNYANRDVYTVGVLHPSSTSDDSDTLQRRDWVRHLWSSDAVVIDGNEVDIANELRGHIQSLV